MLKWSLHNHWFHNSYKNISVPQSFLFGKPLKIHKGNEYIWTNLPPFTCIRLSPKISAFPQSSMCLISVNWFCFRFLAEEYMLRNKNTSNFSSCLLFISWILKVSLWITWIDVLVSSNNIYRMYVTLKRKLKVKMWFH